jgi:rSAM/selenodomain-associated transferase 1
MLIAPIRTRKRERAPPRRVAPFRCRLVIMARAPVAGAAKTRLAREVGLAVAMRFARHCSAALIARVGLDPRWHTSLWVTPDASRYSRHWPGRLARVPQRHGDLGRRMQRVLDFARPGPVVMIGTDIPAIRPAHIAAAFRALGRVQCVFGPATDGGYWLIGVRRRPHVPRPFDNVRWSSEHALADTLANLAGRPVGFAATLSDVDDATTLARCGGFGRVVTAGTGRGSAT